MGSFGQFDRGKSVKFGTEIECLSNATEKVHGIESIDMTIIDSRFKTSTKQLVELAIDSEIGGKLLVELQRLNDTLNEGKTSASQSQFQERVDINNRMKGFEMKRSRAYHAIASKGFEAEKFNVLLSMGTILAEQARITIDRQAKRRKTVFFKWLEDHWDTLEPHFACLEMEVQGSEDEG